MAVIVVVLQDSNERVEVCRAIEREGHRAIPAQDGSCVTLGSPALSGLVFARAEVAATGLSISQLRRDRPDLFLIEIGASQGTDRHRTRESTTAVSVEHPAERRVTRIDFAATLTRCVRRAIICQARRKALRASFDELHRRLLAGDQDASEQIFRLVTPELRRRLRHWIDSECAELLEITLRTAADTDWQNR
jgi:hypothetical protein